MYTKQAGVARYLCCLPARNAQSGWRGVGRNAGRAPALWIAAVLLLLLSAPVHATNGFELVGYSPVSKGLAGAGSALPMDSSWSITNPAGIATLDRRFDQALSFYTVHRTLEPHGLAANPFPDKLVDDHPIGGGDTGIVWPGKHVVFAAGFYSMFGLTTNYSEPRSIVPLLTLRRWDNHLNMYGVRIPFTAAKRLGDGWSLGVSLNLNLQTMTSDHLTLKLRETAGQKDYSFSYGFGLTFGVLKEWKRFSLAAAYSTPQWMTPYEEYKDLFPRSFDYPQKLQLGLAVHVTKKLALALDYKWLNWAGVPQFGRSIVKNGLGWDDQHVIKGGLYYELSKRWAVMCGASYAKTPMDDNQVFVHGLAPLIISTHVCAGLGYRINEHHELTCAYTLFVPNSKTERGQGDIFGFLGKGTKITASAHSLSLGYSYYF